MSKFLTLKKGLAISAVVALGFTGVSVLPASAGGVDPTRVSLAPTTGVEYNVTTGSTFNLTSTLNTGQLPAAGSLKFRIANATSADDITDGSLVRTRNTVPLTAATAEIIPTGDTSATYELTVSNGYKYEVGDNIKLTSGIPARTVTVDLPDDTLLTCDGTDSFDPDAGIAGDGTTNYTFTAIAADTVVTVTSVSGDKVSFSATVPTMNNTSANGTCGAGESGDQIIRGNIRPGMPQDITVSAAIVGIQSNVGGTANIINDEVTSPALVVDTKVNGGAAVAGTLALSISGTTTRSFIVTAWGDANGDNLIDSNEYTSTPQTVTFINPAAVVLATDGFVFTSPSAAGNTLTARITTVPVLNQFQSLHVPRAFFTKQVSSANVLGAVVNHWGSSVRATAAPNAGFEAVTSTTLNVGTNSAGFYSARPYLADRNSANGSAAGAAVSAGAVATTFNSVPTFALGAAVAATIAADRVLDIIASVAGSNNTSPVDTYGGGTSFVRLGTAEVVVSALATIDGDDTPAGAGKKVVASIGSGFKIDGVDGPVTLTTDASGKVSVKITKTAPATAGTATVTFTATNVDGGVPTTNIDLVWEAASYDLFNTNDTNSSDVRDEISVAANKSVSFAFVVHDQWKVPAPTASYRVLAAISGSGVSTTSTGALGWSGNTANLTVTNNGTIGLDVIEVDVDVQKLTGSTWANSDDSDNIDISVVSASQTFRAEAAVGNSFASDFGKIQNTNQVLRHDPRTSQVAPKDYVEGRGVSVDVTVRESVTGLVRPYAKVTITGPSDFMFTASELGSQEVETIQSLGSLVAWADESGMVYFSVKSNRSVVDAELTVTTEDGTGSTLKVTFKNPEIEYGVKAVWSNLPKSIKGGRTLTASVSITDKWGNAVLEDGDIGSQSVQVTTNRGLVNVSRPTNDSPTTFQVQVILQPLDRGPVVLNFIYEEGDLNTDLNPNDTIRSTVAVWSGPAVNATAGAKKGRVVIESYRAKGKTVNVFVGSTRVASFTPDAANDRFVVRGVKSGTRNVSVRITGPGFDFPRTAITVK